MKLVKKRKIKIVYKGEEYIFYIEPPTFSFALEVQKEAVTKSEGEIGLKVLKETLCGWENLYDENGKEVPFSKDMIESVIKALPSPVVAKLVEYISEETAELVEERSDELGN